MKIKKKQSKLGKKNQKKEKSKEKMIKKQRLACFSDSLPTKGGLPKAQPREMKKKQSKKKQKKKKKREI